MKKILLPILLASAVIAGCQTTNVQEAEVAISPQLNLAIQKFAKEDVAYRVALEDLNHDGIQDSIVFLSGSNWCGTGGCTMLVFEGLPESQYRLLSVSTVADTPVYLLDSQTFNWSDIAVHSIGRGLVKMQRSVGGYPRNPSLQPKFSTDKSSRHILKEIKFGQPKSL